MFKKTCVRCTKKFKKKELVALRAHNDRLFGYACKKCFEVLDTQFNFTGKHPKRPPQ